MQNVFAAFLPHVISEGDVLIDELEDAAKRLLAAEPSDEVVELLLGLPLEQVTGWIDELRASRSTKVKRRAAAYTKRLPA